MRSHQAQATCVGSSADGDQHGWAAHLHLEFHKYPGKTVLASSFRKGPLAVQRAFYPEGDLCHVYLLHPPGGVAGGDTLEIHAKVAEGASALVTTPGAAKFYRTVGPMACQHQILHADAGTLEWLPQENILFPGAKVQLNTVIELTGGASFIGWEINCLGRPAVAERFEAGSAVFNFRLQRDGQPLLLERIIVTGESDLSSPAGLRGKPVFGMLCATLADKTLLEDIREKIPLAHRHELGVTLVDGLLIARYLGDSTEVARLLFYALWKILRPAVLQRAPCAPRIWKT